MYSWRPGFCSGAFSFVSASALSAVEHQQKRRSNPFPFHKPFDRIPATGEKIKGIGVAAPLFDLIVISKISRLIYNYYRSIVVEVSDAVFPWRWGQSRGGVP